MRVRCALRRLLLAIPTALFACSAATARAQRGTPAGIARSEVASVRLFAPTQAVEILVSRDSTERRSAQRYVVTGAILGALVVVLLYVQSVDVDHAFPFSLILPVSLGAIIGAYVGFVLRPM